MPSNRTTLAKPAEQNPFNGLALAARWAELSFEASREAAIEYSKPAAAAQPVYADWPRFLDSDRPTIDLARMIAETVEIVRGNATKRGWR